MDLINGLICTVDSCSSVLDGSSTGEGLCVAFTGQTLNSHIQSLSSTRYISNSVPADLMVGVTLL